MKQQETWHLSKKVPIGIVALVVAHIFSFGLYVSSISNRLENIENWREETIKDRFRKDDAKVLEMAIEQNKNSIEIITSEQNKQGETLHKIDRNVAVLVEKLSNYQVK